MKRATTSTTPMERHKKSKKNLYIRIAKSAPNFQGSRESVPVEDFDINDCSPQGLIIPLFSRTAFGKCRKSDGYPTDICVRYQGVLDMDMAMGIFNDEVIPPFTVKMGGVLKFGRPFGPGKMGPGARPGPSQRTQFCGQFG